MAKKNGSAVNIIEGIVIAILILLIAGMLFVYFSFRDTGAAPNIFGHTIYHTKAVSMQPEIPSGSAVIAKSSEIENIKVGSVVLCRIGEDTVLTRVVQLVSENGQMSYVVKFDTAPPNDTFKIPQENVIAKAIWTNRSLGAVLSFATSTFGIMLVIIIPSFVIIVFQIVRIINVKRAEEDAVSLDDLEEIMIRNDTEDAEDAFREPSRRSNDDTPLLKPMKMAEPEAEKPVETLSVDKNGRAGLRVTAPSDVPLFTYDSMEKQKNDTAVKVKPGKSVVKPVKTPNTDDFYTNYVSNSERDPLYGDRIKRQEIIPDPEEEAAQTEAAAPSAAEPVKEYKPAFMSNVIPEKIVSAVSEAEKPPQQPVPAPAAVKPVHGDKAMRAAQSIPEKAALPKDKLAPPAKKSTGKTISELMSIIDAEESKLK